MSSAVAAAPARAGIFRQATARETAVLLGLAWVLPFAVHLVPWSGPRPLGAALLPMFWATFVALYFYGARTGLVVGLFAPALNLLVTGLPALQFLGVLSVELVLFVAVGVWAMRRSPRVWAIAPLAYLAAKVGSTALQAATGVFGGIGAPAEFFLRSVGGGLAGLAVLAAINGALVRAYPKTVTSADDAPAV